MRVKILSLATAVDRRVQVQSENSDENATYRDQFEFIVNDGENVYPFLGCTGAKHKAC